MTLVLALAGGCASNCDDWRKATPAVAWGAGESIRFVDAPMATDASGAVESPLTLPDAIRRALNNSAEVQAALARVRIAQTEAGQARLLPNPVLSVTVRLPQGAGTFIDAGLSEDLVALLQRPRRIDAADDRLRSAAAEALTAAVDVLADVQEKYVAVQTHDALLPVFEERRRLLDQLLALAQNRLNQGEGTRLDVTTIDAQRADLETDLAEEQLEARRDRIALARLLGQPSGAADWKVAALGDAIFVPAESEADWIAVGLRKRPEVEAQRWELAALGIEAHNAGLSAFEGSEVGVDAEKDADWAVGPSVSVALPLFDWGQERKAKAKAQVVEAHHNLTKLRRQIIEEIRSAYSDLRITAGMLRSVQDRLLPVQERRRADTEAAYKAGQTDVTALIIAEQDRQAAQAKSIQLRQRVETAHIRLMRAAGSSDPLATTRPATTAPATEPVHEVSK